MDLSNEEKNIEFLWKSSKILTEIGKRTEQNVDPLRVHFRDLCASQDDRLVLDKKLFRVRSMCPKCLTFWSECRFKLRLVSCKRPKRSSRRLLSQDPGQLSGYRKKLHSLLSNPRDNILELTCCVCNNKSRIPLRKPDKIVVNEPIPEVNEEEEIVKSQKKKKKKKKKEQFAGLNVEFVLQKKGNKPVVKTKNEFQDNEVSGLKQVENEEVHISDVETKMEDVGISLSNQKPGIPPGKVKKEKSLIECMSMKSNVPLKNKQEKRKKNKKKKTLTALGTPMEKVKFGKSSLLSDFLNTL